MIFNIAKELFYTLTGALVIFIALEIIWRGIVLAYVNINWLLIFWLIVGIVILVLENRKQDIIISICILSSVFCFLFSAF